MLWWINSLFAGSIVNDVEEIVALKRNSKIRIELSQIASLDSIH